MTPGLKTVRARVTDNGAMSGADNIRRTKTVSATFLVDTPPVATATSVETETGIDLPVTLQAGDADGDTLTYSITDGNGGTSTASVTQPWCQRPVPAILRRSSGLGAIFADSSRFQPSATGIPACWQIWAATVIPDATASPKAPSSAITTILAPTRPR
jgi:hypothetical protein